MPTTRETTYTFQQIKEIMDQHEETLMKFFNNTVDRLEKKIGDLQYENVQLKKGMEELKTSISFNSDLMENKIKEIDSLKNEIKERKNNSIQNIDDKCEEIDNKLAEIEDRSRRNNLRFDGFVEKGVESWQESEVVVRTFIKNELDIDSKIEIERAHRTGERNNKNRSIIVKFLNYKDKVCILKNYKEKQLWNNKKYVNEDFSERTQKRRKELFGQAKILRGQGKYAKVVYTKLIVHDNKYGEQ